MNRTIFTFFLVVVFAAATPPYQLQAQTCNRNSDSLALVALYNATDGPNWTNTWDLNQPMDTWHGVTLSGEGCLVELKLSNNQLSGTIPPEIGNLGSLSQLNLSNNELSGTIPSEIGNLSSLFWLYLSSNQLGGTIPSEIGNLSSLEELWLTNNQLSGAIPSEIGNLSSLIWLHLSNNELSGTIPSEIGNLNVVELRLSNNELSGTIPSEIGNLSSLFWLYLSSNELGGTIPSEIGNLISLETLYLDDNQLSGSIPVELGNLSNLRELSFSSNQLSGSIPSELGNLSNLTRLYVQNNLLSGCFPPELSAFCSLGFSTNVNSDGYNFTNNPDLPGGGDFEAFCNTGSGGCPSCSDGIQNGDETGIDCGGQLCGPCGGCNHPDYTALEMIYNSLGGDNWTVSNHGWLSDCDPCSWYGIECDQGRVTCIDLDGNVSCNNSDFGSGIGAFGDIGNIAGISLPFLESFHLSNNSVSGNIPDFQHIPNLIHLGLSNNQLAGTIPNFSNLANLTHLFLESNLLTGNIPEFNNMASLTVFIAKVNMLDGSLPAFEYSPNIWTVYVGNNNLSGEIPVINNMNYFRIESNNFSGCFPDYVCDLVQFSATNNPQLPWGGNPYNFCVLGIDQNGEGSCPEPQILGCLDPSAHNYNPDATQDNGSCETCTDGIQNGDETGVDCGGILCGTCGPKNIYVDYSATGNNNGTSWQDAYKKLNDAFMNSDEGDHIHIAEGNYYPDEYDGLDTNNPNDYFYIKNDQKIYGGYPAGGGDSPAPWIYETVLNGDIDQDSTLANNAYNLVYTKNVSSSTSVEGIVIQGGNSSIGGNIYTRPVTGAGWFNDGADGGSSNPSLFYVTFRSNKTNQRGAGMFNYGMGGDASPTYLQCFFMDNDGRIGGGLYNFGQNNGKSSPQIEGCLFEGNTADWGGGIVNDGTTNGESSIQIFGSIFRENEAIDGYGAAIHTGGGFSGLAEPFIINSLFHDNHASDGGGALSNWGNINGTCAAHIENSTFTQNTTSGLGAVIRSNGESGTCTVNIVNSIFWDNLQNGSTSSISGFLGSNIINHSLVQDFNEDGDAVLPPNSSGSNNIDWNPGFVDPNLNNFRLTDNSPAIDAGVVGSNTSNEDLDNNERVVNQVIDLGAYENQTLPVMGCTNPTAHNYNPIAAQDDGFCETCSDGIQNGDEAGIDCGGQLCGPCNTYYADADGDTHGDPGNPVLAATAPAGYVANSGDCDDTNSAVNPSASEICNGRDDNCNNSIDEGLDCGGCHSAELAVHSSPIPSNTYASSTSIVSAGTVADGSSVYFQAAQSITLQPGFHAQPGSDFLAMIGDCTPAPMAQEGDSERIEDDGQKFTEMPEREESSLNIFPNPFRNETTIRYQLPEDRPVQLVLIDMLGRARVLQSVPMQPAGVHEYVLNRKDLTTGMYFIQLQTGDEVITKKVQVLQ